MEVILLAVFLAGMAMRPVWDASWRPERVLLPSGILLVHGTPWAVRRLEHRLLRGGEVEMVHWGPLFRVFRITDPDYEWDLADGRIGVRLKDSVLQSLFAEGA